MGKMKKNYSSNNIKEYSKVYVTKDYTIFKTLEGNRLLNKKNLSKLMKSIAEDGVLAIPIIVSYDETDGKFFVVDGQHRLSVCEQLGKEVYFIVEEDYGIKEVMIANATSTNWTKNDFLNLHLNSKKEAYLKFQELMGKYGINIFSLLKITALAQNQTVSAINHAFEMGTFTLSEFDIIEIESFFVALEDFEIYFDGSKNKPFISAFSKLFSHPNYDHEQMKAKLSSRGGLLKQTPNLSPQYLAVLCNEIYSFNVSGGKAIRYIAGKFIS